MSIALFDVICTNTVNAPPPPSHHYPPAQIPRQSKNMHLSRCNHGSDESLESRVATMQCNAGESEFNHPFNCHRLTRHDSHATSHTAQDTRNAAHITQQRFRTDISLILNNQFWCRVQGVRRTANTAGQAANQNHGTPHGGAM